MCMCSISFYMMEGSDILSTCPMKCCKYKRTRERFPFTGTGKRRHCSCDICKCQCKFVCAIEDGEKLLVATQMIPTASTEFQKKMTPIVVCLSFIGDIFCNEVKSGFDAIKNDFCHQVKNNFYQ